MKPTSEIIDEVLRLDKGATDGPWEPFDCGPQGGMGSGLAIGERVEMWPLFDQDSNEGRCNSFLTARYRTLAPRLARALKIAEDRLQKLCECANMVPMEKVDSDTPLRCLTCDWRDEMNAALNAQEVDGENS